MSTYRLTANVKVMTRTSDSRAYDERDLGDGPGSIQRSQQPAVHLSIAHTAAAAAIELVLLEIAHGHFSGQKPADTCRNRLAISGLPGVSSGHKKARISGQSG